MTETGGFLKAISPASRAHGSGPMRRWAAGRLSWRATTSRCRLAEGSIGSRQLVPHRPHRHLGTIIQAQLPQQVLNVPP